MQLGPSQTQLFQRMVMSFRISELQALLQFAGRPRSGRKKDLLENGLELVRIRSTPIHMKIRELYKSIK